MNSLLGDGFRPFDPITQKLKGIKMSLRRILGMLAISVLASQAANAARIPANAEATVVTKVMALEQKIASSEEVSIHVIDAPEVAEALEKRIGRKIGIGKLVKVTSSKSLPTQPVSAIYIGSKKVLDEALAYSRENNILSVTGVDSLKGLGVSLEVDLFAGKPNIAINTASATEEELTFDVALERYTVK